MQDIKTKEKGYIFSDFLNDDRNTKLKLNRSYDHVYVGKTNSKRIKAVYDGDESVIWKSSDTNIFTVASDGTVTGKNPGVATLTAKVGIQSASCTIYCVYEWKQEWKAKAFIDSEIKKGNGTDTGTIKKLPQDAIFTVLGDDGSVNGWAYGFYEPKKGEEYWDFVKINDISTKGTISQYNSMGWSYPIKNNKFKYISSPYSWRSTGRHLGMDISKGTYSSIIGEELVAAFDGRVIWLNRSYNYTTKKPDYGYCIVIESNQIDPVSGNKIRAVYMHMLEKPNLELQQSVIAGTTVLGKVGSTGYSSGPHLHFEVNNCAKNFAGSTNSDSFDKTINPVFFYLNKELGDSDSSTFNEYWYNDNK